MPIPGTPLIQGTRARDARVDSIDFDSISIERSDPFQRFAKADPKNCDAGELRELRNEVHGYHCKFGNEPNPHAPDDMLLAQLLAIASLEELRRMLQTFRDDRTVPGREYGWYITLAFQRIHHVPPLTTKRTRKLIEVAKRRQTIVGEQEPLSLSEQSRQHSDGTPYEEHAPSNEFLEAIQTKAKRSKF